MSVADSSSITVGSSATPDYNFKFLIDDLGGMTLKSGGGTNTVLDITSAGAIKGVKFPATQVPSADVNTLDDYEEYTAATAACTGAITTSSSYKVTKIGRVVTIELPITTGTASAVAQFTFGTVLPTRFRPSGYRTSLSARVQTAGAAQTNAGLIFVDTAGNVSVYLNGTGTATYSGTAGLFDVATITYFV